MAQGLKFDFFKNKYGRELLIDCLILGKTKKFLADEPPYTVSFHEIIFITEGEGIFKFDTHTMPFKPGTVLFLQPDKWRQWVHFEDKPDGYVILFEEDFIATFFNDIDFLYRFHFFYTLENRTSVQLDPETFKNLTEKLKEIRKEIRQLGDDSDHLLRAILYYVLIKLNRSYKEKYKLHGEFFEEPLILTFRRLLEKHIREFKTVAGYADLRQVSKTHLNSQLKKHFNKNCSDIIKDRLLKEIKRELLFSRKNVAEICYELNFSEPSNLNRFFKKRTGMTPQEFRQAKLNESS